MYNLLLFKLYKNVKKNKVIQNIVYIYSINLKKIIYLDKINLFFHNNNF